MFRTGDYVIPVDLPRSVLCRVAQAESAHTSTGAFQILTLEPLQGPWREEHPRDPVIRFDQDVRRAGTRELWQTRVDDAAA